jgi:hypothetical protein
MLACRLLLLVVSSLAAACPLSAATPHGALLGILCIAEHA